MADGEANICVSNLVPYTAAIAFQHAARPKSLASLGALRHGGECVLPASALAGTVLYCCALVWMFRVVACNAWTALLL